MTRVASSQKTSQQPRLLNLVIIIALVAYAVASIILFWHSPYLLTLILLPAPVVLVLRLGPVGFGLALAGAVLGPVTEIFCVAGGLWTYADTGGLLFIPPWLITIWACFPTALWLIVRSILGEIPSVRPGTLALALAGIAVEIVIFVSLGDRTPLAITAALPLAVAIFLAWPKRSTLILMAAGSLLGPVAESLPIAAGAWSYANPQVLGMPVWLPLAYAMFAVLVGYAAGAISLHIQMKRWKKLLKLNKPK